MMKDGVSEIMAYRISEKYPSIRSLFDAYKSCSTEKEKEELITNTVKYQASSDRFVRLRINNGRLEEDLQMDDDLQKILKLLKSGENLYGIPLNVSKKIYHSFKV